MIAFLSALSYLCIAALVFMWNELDRVDTPRAFARGLLWPVLMPVLLASGIARLVGDLREWIQERRADA